MRRRGRDVEIPRRRVAAATLRLRRSVETSRGDACGLRRGYSVETGARLRFELELPLGLCSACMRYCSLITIQHGVYTRGPVEIERFLAGALLAGSGTRAPRRLDLSSSQVLGCPPRGRRAKGRRRRRVRDDGAPRARLRPLRRGEARGRVDAQPARRCRRMDRVGRHVVRVRRAHYAVGCHPSNPLGSSSGCTPNSPSSLPTGLPPESAHRIKPQITINHYAAATASSVGGRPPGARDDLNAHAPGRALSTSS